MKLMVFLSVILAAVTVRAQTNDMTSLPAKPVRIMSLQDCIQEALQHNFDVQIARFDPQISLFDLRAAYGAYDPTFTAGAEYDYDKTRGNLNPTFNIVLPGSTSHDEVVSSGINGGLPWGMTYGLSGNLDKGYGTSGGNYYNKTDGRVTGTLTQPLLQGFWMNGSRLTINLAKKTLRSAEAGLKWQMIKSITEVESAYYNLIAAQENVKVQEKGLQLAEQLLAENKKRVEVGALAPLDEKQSASQVATARADLLTARQTQASAENALKSLITDDFQGLHAVTVQPLESLAAPVQGYNVMESWNKGMNRPDLEQLKLLADKAGIQLKFDRNNLFPQLDVTGSYGYHAGGAGTVTYNDGFNDFTRGDQPFYSVGASLSVPLSYQGQRNQYKSSKASVKKAILEYKQLEQQILSDIDTDIISAKATYERVDATREARIYAEAALEAEQKKLESGKSTSFQVLQLQKDLTAARSAEIGALADYNIALAKLAQDEGSTLERNNVDVQRK